MASARDDHRLAALDDPAQRTLAERITHVMERPAEADRGFDTGVAAVILGEHDQAANDAMLPRQCLEDLLQRRFEVERAREGAAGLEQRRETLMRVRRPFVSG